MVNTFRAYYHQDGEWDCSMSRIDGEEFSWQDSVVLETEDGTEITLHDNGRIEVESNELKVKEKR